MRALGDQAVERGGVAGLAAFFAWASGQKAVGVLVGLQQEDIRTGHKSSLTGWDANLRPF
jgi:hypothetical protein